MIRSSLLAAVKRQIEIATTIILLCRLATAGATLSVVDSNFRVIVAKNLRIVDALVFPKIFSFSSSSR